MVRSGADDAGLDNRPSSPQVAGQERRKHPPDGAAVVPVGAAEDQDVGAWWPLCFALEDPVGPTLCAPSGPWLGPAAHHALAARPPLRFQSQLAGSQLFGKVIDRINDTIALPRDAAVLVMVTGAVFFAFLYELGHALVDQLELPVTGKEEDAVDQLAAVILDEGAQQGRDREQTRGESEHRQELSPLLRLGVCDVVIWARQGCFVNSGSARVCLRNDL